MDYSKAIERVYDHLENDHVDKALMVCLRIARNLKDYLYSAIFLREIYPNNQECMRVIFDDTNHLNDDAKKYFYETANNLWLNIHTMDFSLLDDEDGTERNVLKVGISEIDHDILQCERSIEDLQVPSGMHEYDIASFTDQHIKIKGGYRLRIRALQTIKQRVKYRCLNYAIRVERQLQSQEKTQIFLAKIQTDVNNYFRAHSDDVYTKLQKSAQLVDSIDQEDNSLLLTEVRRAIKATADFFYPPKEGLVRCSDGKERALGEEQYLNRMHEFIALSFTKSTSRDLLKSEFDYLSVISHKLNDVASKGVHSEVTSVEAKQGLVDLYLFLYNVTSRLQMKGS